MTVAEEIDEPKTVFDSQPTGQLVTIAAQKPIIPKTLRECRTLAKRLAYNIVTGYVEHDRGHLDKSAEAFFQVYLHLFPDLNAVRSWNAAELYVRILVKQDEIENYPDHDRTQIADDPHWEEVRTMFLDFSRILGIPDSYADSTMNYYRFHGVRDSRYVNYCIESDRVFNSRVIGNDYWSKILGSLLLILTECHDKHDPMGLEMGLQFGMKYFEIILRARSSASQKTPGLVA